MRSLRMLHFIAAIGVAQAQAQLQWSTPMVVNQDANTDVRHDTTPQIATDSNGSIAVAWIGQSSTGTSVSLSRRSNVYIAYSNTAGAVWTAPALLSNPEHFNSEIDLASGLGDEFLLAWTSGDFFSDFRLHLARTTDSGASFTSETIIHQGAENQFDHVSPRVARAGKNLVLSKSNYLLEWYQHQNLDGRIWTCEDGATTWTERAVTDNPSTTNYCRTYSEGLISDGGAHLTALYVRKYYDQQMRRRFMVMTSADSGATWTNHNDISPIVYEIGFATLARGANNTWIIAAMEMDRPLRNDRTFFYRSTQNGTTWTSVGSISPPATTVDVQAFPSLATNGNGTWLYVFSGAQKEFSNGYKSDGDILFSMSTDDGLTWSPCEPVSASPVSDTAIDTAPQAQYLGSGKWAVVWARAENYDDDSEIVISLADTTASSVADWQLY